MKVLIGVTFKEITVKTGILGDVKEFIWGKKIKMIRKLFHWKIG